METANLPVFTKCCSCIPLRYGLLTWGYIKLAAALLALSFYILIVVLYSKFIISDDILIVIISLIAVILATEIILHIIFIIGAHMKSLKLLQAYFYYAVFMWIVTTIMSFGGTGYLIFSMISDQEPRLNVLFSFIIVCFVFYIVVQIFLVLSLRSEIIKLKSHCPYRFVKNENDPEGTINSVKDEEEMSIDNGTMRIL